MPTTRRHFFQRLFQSSKPAPAPAPSVSFRPLGVEPYIGEVLLTGHNFAPRGWMACSGQLLPIAQNIALFSILGTTYGGNGTSTFALPNLNGRVAVGVGQGPGLSSIDLGEASGINTETLISSQLPARSLTVNEVEVRGVGGTQGTGLAKGAVSGSGNVIVGNSSATAFNHTPPYLGLMYIIAVQGVFPPRP